MKFLLSPLHVRMRNLGICMGYRGVLPSKNYIMLGRAVYGKFAGGGGANLEFGA